MNEHDCVPIQLYLQKQAGRADLAHTFPNSAVNELSSKILRHIEIRFCLYTRDAHHTHIRT